MTEFENVNANIKRIIKFRGASSTERKLGIDNLENDDDDDIEDNYKKEGMNNNKEND